MCRSLLQTLILCTLVLTTIMSCAAPVNLPSTTQTPERAEQSSTTIPRATATSLAATATRTQSTTPVVVATYPISQLPRVTRPAEEIIDPDTVPLSWIYDMVFVDPLHGWLLGQTCTGSDRSYRCKLQIRATADGGQTWKRLNAPNATIKDFADVPVPTTEVQGIIFASETHGWLYGPDLFVTTDGGQTWQHEARHITAIAPIGESVWAVEIQQGQPTLITSQDYGQHWQIPENQPAQLNANTQLVRNSPNSAWLRSSVNGTASTLLRTTDGGNHWMELPDPTQSEFWNLCSLAATNETDLWLACGGQGATIMQSKRLYRSADGGGTWQIFADTPFQGQGVGSLPISGHFLKHKQLAAISPTQALIGLSRTTMFVSYDRGQLWEVAIPDDNEYLETSGIYQVVFIDPQHGWAFTGTSGFFRSVNGGVTWSYVKVV